MSYKEFALKYYLNLENLARHKLIKRYDKPLSYHDMKMINDILYNEKTHYVEAFKEYLIYEDYNEFLKRYYKRSELRIKLPKILNFYEKYSKIYANYTVIPESKYMYKNIKRKQKMIDQMQNNDINNSDNEEEEEENEEISNTVFSSKVMNSIFNKTLSTLNKSDNGNTEQSINNFVSQINDIEVKANQTKTNVENKKIKKIHKNIILPNKMNKILMIKNSKQNSKNKIQINDKENFLNSKRNNSNNSKNKNIEVQFTYSKKSIQKELNNINNKTNNNEIINSNRNYNSNNTNFQNTKPKNSNMILINDYMSKIHYSNSNSILNNNNSIGNNTNNSNTFHSHKNSMKMNDFSKQKIRQNIIYHSKCFGMKENMSETNISYNNNIYNINNYFSNQDNNFKHSNKYKLSLGETLLKHDKIVLSTNTSCSPNAIQENLFSGPSRPNNIFVNKRRLLLKEKLIEKGYLSPGNNSLINNNNEKKIKPNLLVEYNSAKKDQNFMEYKTQKNLNKSNKKKISKKIIDIQNVNADNKNYILSEAQSNINIKKPESHRNYYHNQISSNYIKNNLMSNTNKTFKIKVGIKQDFLSKNYKNAKTAHCSHNSCSYNSYYNLPNNKNLKKNNQEINLKNPIKEINKKKVVNYNIINNIQDNSTQINIYTGNDLYKSLHIHDNSAFNSPPVSGTSSRSPIERGIGEKIKNKNNIQNTIYFKSQIKGKVKNKYNLNLKKIISKRILERQKERCLESERLMTHNKLLEKLEKYLLKNNNENNKKININNKNNNNNRNNILYNNYTKNTNTENLKFITKIISKNIDNTNSKQLKNKTNNNTPLKRNYNKFLNDNKQNKCLSPKDTSKLFRKISKQMKKQKINYNNIMSNLNDVNNIEFNENKFLINSERNKNYKIIFK